MLPDATHDADKPWDVRIGRQKIFNLSTVTGRQSQCHSTQLRNTLRVPTHPSDPVEIILHLDPPYLRRDGAPLWHPGFIPAKWPDVRGWLEAGELILSAMIVELANCACFPAGPLHVQKNA